jgi:hypothetical protein
MGVWETLAVGLKCRSSAAGCLRERKGARADARRRAYKWRGEGVGERWAFGRRWRCAREAPTKEGLGARRRCHLREREAMRSDAMRCYKE